MRLRLGKSRPAAAWRARPAAAACAALAVLLTACGNEGPPELGHKGLQCVDDSPACISQRSNALNEMVTDRSRQWVREPVPPVAYASGVRLFAYKQRKRELTCEELSIGRKEAEAGPAILRGPDGKHLSTAQVARGVMLSQEVGRELGNEMKRRCRA
jgi:hypothetical protein